MTREQQVRGLADLMQAARVDEVVTYDDMSSVIGEDIRGRVRFLITAARRLANEESGALFYNERNVGYVRLSASDSYIVGVRMRKSIRNRSSIAAKSIGLAISKANEVSEEGARRAWAEQAALGLLQHLARDRAMPRPDHDRPPPDISEVVRQSVDALRQYREASRL